MALRLARLASSESLATSRSESFLEETSTPTNESTGSTRSWASGLASWASRRRSRRRFAILTPALAIHVQMAREKALNLPFLLAELKRESQNLRQESKFTKENVSTTLSTLREAKESIDAVTQMLHTNLRLQRENSKRLRKELKLSNKICREQDISIRFLGMDWTTAEILALKIADESDAIASKLLSSLYSDSTWSLASDLSRLEADLDAHREAILSGRIQKDFYESLWQEQQRFNGGRDESHYSNKIISPSSHRFGKRRRSSLISQTLERVRNFGNWTITKEQSDDQNNKLDEIKIDCDINDKDDVDSRRDTTRMRRAQSV